MPISLLLGVMGTKEILIIAIIILLLFGGSKIPKLMKGLGQGINEFKKGVHGKDSGPETPSD